MDTYTMDPQTTRCWNGGAGMMSMKTRTSMLAASAMSLMAAVAAATGVLPAAPAPAPFSFDAAPGRLPKNVVPLNYSVSIVPNPTKLTFTGSESVQLQFRSATATLVFNSVNETLHNVRLDGKPVKSVASDDTRQLTTVRLLAQAPTGPHTLSFSYQGKIKNQPHGLFAQPYEVAGGGPGLLLSTQMEATDARRMFPCWDEPSFRARFQLTAAVPENFFAVSNMPVESETKSNGVKETRLAMTPSMSSYLNVFVAGELDLIEMKSGNTQIRVITTKGKAEMGRYALEASAQILQYYNEYFGV